LATVIVGVEHTPAPADAPLLECVREDPQAPRSTREIAGVLLRFVREPTPTDRAELEALTAPREAATP
jgi:hypothetical protein